MKSEESDPLPAPGELLRVWLSLSVQSFGGGPATLALIHRAFVERNRWIPEAEFTRDWSLCQIAPGINLFALTILIGRRLDGVRGILLSLFGLLLPSVVLTILITAFYARLQRLVGQGRHLGFQRVDGGDPRLIAANPPFIGRSEQLAGNGADHR